METTLDRINLRIAPELMRAIDAARLRRTGNVSRNTWIAEAIVEKLAREEDDAATSLKEAAGA